MIESVEMRACRRQSGKDNVECRSDGLSAAEVRENEIRYGKNILSKKKTETFFGQLIKSFNDPIVKILIGALIINGAANFGRINWAESLGIIAAILIATIVSTVSEYSSCIAYERLSESGERGKYTVRRGGKTVEVAASDIVVGDRVLLFSGMTVPADGVLSLGEVYCNQSALTGEGREMCKKSRNFGCINLKSFGFDLASENQVFSGAAVVKGAGEMTVLRVGDSTFLGDIAKSLQENTRPGPLKLRLTDLAGTIGFMGYVGAFMIAAAYLFNSFFIDSGMDMALVMDRLADTPFLISEILRAVTVAVSVVVVAVPEGLPMMITVVLSSNMKKMMRGGVLVRRLSGIETAGNLNILFTDKTGTLTTGKMSVTNLFGPDWESDANNKKSIKNLENIKKCIGASCIPCGSATERALAKLGFSTVSVAARIPFESRTKYSAGLTEKGDSYFAGAPEVLMSACSFYMDKEGRQYPLESGTLRDTVHRQTDHADKGARVLCLAKGDEKAFRGALCGDLSGLVLIALAVIQDPVRKEVKKSVRECQGAGIQVVMVTGDNPHTARAVACETGIIKDGRGAVIGSEALHGMTDEEVLSLLPRLAVVSRALPSDKIRLVRIAQKAQKVVGMTGDGINDAPALKAADVGFAMGSGTDIAKEAGDIVITDDSFPSITRAVLYGRTVLQSIRKFIVFQLLMNLCAMGVSLIGPFVGIDSPVTVIQMLWVNIIMDTLGGLAFAGEPALSEYMRYKSPKRDEKLVSGKMVSQILITGGYTLALGIFFLKSGWVRELFGGNDMYHLTAFFATFIFCGIFNSFNARTERINIFSHLGSNKPFVLIMVLVAAIQLLIIYFGGEVFRCTPLAPVHLLYAALFAMTVVPADMIRKLLFRNIR